MEKHTDWGTRLKNCIKWNEHSDLGCLLLSIFTAAAFNMDMEIVSDEFMSQITNSQTHIAQLLYRLAYSVKAPGISGLLFVLFCFVLYKYSASLGRMRTEEKVLGVLMALTCLFGRAFYQYNSTVVLVTGFVQMVKTAVMLAGMLLFFPHFVKAVRQYVPSHFRFQGGFDMASLVWYRRVVWGILLAVWTIHLIAYFLGMFMGDTEDIVYMAYNLRTGLVDTVNLISEDVLVVDHHSVLYTVILGAFVKLGRLAFHSENIGIFLYTVCQMLFTAWVLAYALYKLKCYRVGAWFRTAILLFFSLFPWIPRYAIMATKDTLFADFMMLYLLLVIDIVEQNKEQDSKIKRQQLAGIILYAVLIFLLRKNGLYMVILSLPFLIMMNKKWAKSIIIALVCIFAVKFVYTNVILPAAKIPDGSVSAALSIPLQQTSRYLKYHADEVTQEERAAINAVANVDALPKVYWPDRSDWAKASWRKDATGEDIRNYFITWAKMLVKHPLTYVAATANNYYAYFYPVVTDLYDFERASDGGIASANAEGYFAFKASDSRISMSLREFLRLFDAMLMNIPFVNLLCTSAIYIWLLILSWTQSLVGRDRKLLMAVIPMLMLMLTILSGPCNGNIYHRFTYPVAMCMPVIAAYGIRSGRHNSMEGVDTVDREV